MGESLGVLLIAFASVFLLTVLVLRFLIPVLREKKLGQKILEIGPDWHKSKEGTPTMGGIAFILAILTVAGGYFLFRAAKGETEGLIPVALTLAFAVANGAIGFVDDYVKLFKKRNEGLTEWQKGILQVTVASAYLCVMTYTGNFETSFRIPFTDLFVDLGIAAYPLVIFLLFLIVNGANFTDGIDGLASGVCSVEALLIGIVALAFSIEELSLFSGLLLGATLGFLVYNHHPASVFMGDTGSLFLGSFVIATFLQIGEFGCGILVCLLYLIELASSGLQRLYFKLTHGKRIFLMAPIHHHFEKLGWSETRIVWVFSLVELVFCALCFASL